MSDFGGKLDEHFDSIYLSNVRSMEQYEKDIEELSYLLYTNRDSDLVEEALSECESLEWVCNYLANESSDNWMYLFTRFQEDIRSYCDRKAVELYRKYGDKAYDYV